MKRFLLVPILALLIFTADVGANTLFETLPALPDSAWTQLGWSHVTRKADPQCGEGHDSTQLVFGCTSMETRDIEVRSSLSRQAAWQTLEHEKAHLMFFDNGIQFPSHQLEERMCDIAGNTRVQEMLADARNR